MMEEDSIKKERAKIMQTLSNTRDQKAREALMKEDEELRIRLTNLYARQNPQVQSAAAQAKAKMDELNRMQAMGKEAWMAEQRYKQARQPQNQRKR